MNKVALAIIAIFILEAIALEKGQNGSLLRLGIAAIAGLAGLATPLPKIMKFIKETLKNG